MGSSDARQPSGPIHQLENELLDIAAVAHFEPMTQAGLAARHNLLAFLQALYVSVQEIGNDEVKKALLPGLKRAIKEVG